MSSSSDVDRERLMAAHSTARSRLLAELRPAGTHSSSCSPGTSRDHWIGRLSSSPFATATAISALAIAEQHIDDDAHADGATDSGWMSGVLIRNELSELLTQSLKWLADRQNDDGGWGDTDRSFSNIATTMLVEAAFHLTGVPAKYTGLLERAEAYIKSQGGAVGLKRRYGKDKTFAAPILANCALAGTVPWSKVPALPFELACLPPGLFHRLGLPVVSYAIPALVAIGQVRHQHAPSMNPLVRGARSLSLKRSLQLVEAMQPDSGGFLEATPFTSFVVMSLASIGQADHQAVRKGVEFLLASVGSDGSWPVAANLATRNTSQALSAIDWQFDGDEAASPQPPAEAEAALEWLIACQHRQRRPYTDAATGGWAWTDLSGGVPNARDTATSLLALSAWQRRWPNQRRETVNGAAGDGVAWLLGLQNSDGGFPTFCRGWGKLPFDRSSTDITAHVVRALDAWRRPRAAAAAEGGGPDAKHANIAFAIARALEFLEDAQNADGSWSPLWFGNQHRPDEQNLVYGTVQVLLMYQQLGRRDVDQARRAARWLASIQLAGGGWGPALGPAALKSRQRKAAARDADSDHPLASVEETSLAVEALIPMADSDEQIAQCLSQGLQWLCEAVESGRYIEPSPIGFYFAKLWYYERLYPQIFTVGALGKACRAAASRQEPTVASSSWNL